MITDHTPDQQQAVRVQAHADQVHKVLESHLPSILRIAENGASPTDHALVRIVFNFVAGEILIRQYQIKKTIAKAEGNIESEEMT